MFALLAAVFALLWTVVVFLLPARSVPDTVLALALGCSFERNAQKRASLVWGLCGVVWGQEEGFFAWQGSPTIQGATVGPTVREDDSH